MTEIAPSYWRKPQDEPEDGQACHIRGLSEYIVTNIVYKKDAKGWLDLFATYGAGAFYPAWSVVAWCSNDSIPEVPDAWYEETEARVEKTQAKDDSPEQAIADGIRELGEDAPTGE